MSDKRWELVADALSVMSNLINLREDAAPRLYEIGMEGLRKKIEMLRAEQGEEPAPIDDTSPCMVNGHTYGTLEDEEGNQICLDCGKVDDLPGDDYPCTCGPGHDPNCPYHAPDHEQPAEQGDDCPCNHDAQKRDGWKCCAHCHKDFYKEDGE